MAISYICMCVCERECVYVCVSVCVCPACIVKRYVSVSVLLNEKAIQVEESKGFYLTYNWMDKGAHTFAIALSLKGN